MLLKKRPPNHFASPDAVVDVGALAKKIKITNPIHLALQLSSGLNLFLHGLRICYSSLLPT